MKKYIVIIDRRKYLKYFLVERVVLCLFKLWFVGVVWCYNMWFNEFYVILKKYICKILFSKEKMIIVFEYFYEVYI